MKKLFTTKKDETQEFVDFWTAWQPYARQTDGRGDARDTFFKHVWAGVDPRDIVDGAKCFLRTLKEREYIPLAASWINKRAYEDLAIQERQHQQRISEAQTRRVEQIKQQAQEPASAQIDPERRAQLRAMQKAASTSMRMN
jgi:hypothetical protein